MVFIHGHKNFRVPEGITVDADYSCPRCPYQGHLLVYALERQTTVYFVAVGGKRRSGEGMLICPNCENSFTLTKGKYRKLQMFTEGATWEAAYLRIGVVLEGIGRRTQPDMPDPET